MVLASCRYTELKVLCAPGAASIGEFRKCAAVYRDDLQRTVQCGGVCLLQMLTSHHAGYQ